MAPPFANSAVFIFDAVAKKGVPVQLKVQTRGKVFPRGGRLVELYLEQEFIGKILSGGDGYGFLKHTFQKAGLKTLNVFSGKDKDTGVILVVDTRDKILFIEVETCLGKSFFSPKKTADIKRALTVFGEKFNIVYLTRFIRITGTRKLLAKNQYPRRVILFWQGSQTLDGLQQKGVWLYAMIASSGLLSESSEYIEKRYAFEETEDGTYVRNWQELSKVLK